MPAELSSKFFSDSLRERQEKLAFVSSELSTQVLERFDHVGTLLLLAFN